MGIGEYNKQCRKIVMRYSTEWEVCLVFREWLVFEDIFVIWLVIGDSDKTGTMD